MINKQKKIFCAKAPLRLGLAGGGSDLTPFSEKYGGCILNATINLFVHVFIEPTNLLIYELNVVSSFVLKEVFLIHTPSSDTNPIFVIVPPISIPTAVFIFFQILIW